MRKKNEAFEAIAMMNMTTTAGFRPAIRAMNGMLTTPTRDAIWLLVLNTETRLSQDQVCVPAADLGRHEGRVSV